MTLKQVFIVNSDLKKMRKGKIAVQVAHGEVLYVEHILVPKKDSNDLENGENFFNYLEWRKDGLMKKVVLKATRDEMLFLLGELAKLNVWNEIVIDRGLTQIPADSMTCIVIEPLDEEMADHYFGHLKLL